MSKSFVSHFTYNEKPNKDLEPKHHVTTKLHKWVYAVKRLACCLVDVTSKYMYISLVCQIPQEMYHQK